jgi:acylphosphatase
MESSTVVTMEFVVTGVVQGVGYRWFTRREAHRLGVRGWVRNRPDGSVQVLVQGEAGAVGQLEALLRQGPAGSRVENVLALAHATNETYGSFEVTR